MALMWQEVICGFDVSLDASRRQVDLQLAKGFHWWTLVTS